MSRKWPIPEIAVVALALGAGVAVYWYAHRDEDALEESKARGAAIVQALDAHRTDTGEYPAGLDDLVPRYLPYVDPPTWGLERWRYRRFTPSDVMTVAEPGRVEDEEYVYFQLSVARDESGYPVLYYDYAARRWVLNN
jgi:hypothetical protein